MEAVIERQDSPVIVRTPPPVMKHLYCPCQQDFPGGKRLSWCGVELAGVGGAVPKNRIDLCIICQDIRETGAPCKYCGVKR